ncbi:chorismate mutase [Streptomyces cellulosae]|uniref:chorismate mutase n=1 Tax=Streptomyces cellulosae TaxID=1968 RepID=UPI001F3851DD|nr:chorismate mutase [Streptomyces cellulosae]
MTQHMGELAAKAVKGDGRVATEIDRKEIDKLDAQIIELIQRRHRVSFRIQERRQAEGGPRTVLSRETVVMDRYRQALGPEGTVLVTNILRLCRGPAPDAAPVAAHYGEPTT